LRCGSSKGRGLFSGAWQMHHHPRTLVRRTFNLDAPTQLLNEIIHRRQSKTVTTAAHLGGKEWLEQMAAGFLVHAQAGVIHCEFNVRNGSAFVARRR
jgi:hypothetical protein